jgi:O-antigen ligase
MANRYILTSSGGLKEFIKNGGLSFVACLFCIVILPVYVHYLPPFMILWGLFWIVENRSEIGNRFIIRSKPATLFFIFVVFFLWQLTGLLFSDSINIGFERLFKRLSFLLFPLVLYYPGRKIIENIHLILRLFAICTFIYIVFCFGNALNNSLIILPHKWIFNPHPPEYEYENYFYGARLSYLVHPSYLAMYVVISVLISLESVFSSSVSFFRKLLWLLMILVFLTTLYLLSSRAGILAGIIIIPGYFLFKFYKKFSKWIILIVLVVLTGLFAVIAGTNQRVYLSITGISKADFNKTFEKDERLLIWKSAIGVIKKNIIMGVGTGDASEELKKEFKNRGYINGYYDNLNAHNQFLEILLENGLIGLILFLTILGYMSYIAISQRNILSGLFIIMMFVFFMFETVLNRLSGITFFAFLSFLLIHIKTRLVN